MVDHASNRVKIVDALGRELFGPDPAGPEIEANGEVLLEGFVAAYGPWRQRGSGEEILTRDSPTKRYGVGVLFPVRTALEEIAPRGDEPEGTEEAIEPGEGDEPLEIEAGAPASAAEVERDDLDLSLANSYQPSSFGVSFLAELPHGSKLVVEATGGRYVRKVVTVKTPEGNTTQRTWWLRRPVSISVEFNGEALTTDREARLVARSSGAAATGPRVRSVNADGMDLRVEVFSRPREGGRRLLTVCLVNRTPAGKSSLNELCLFQTHFRARVSIASKAACILPYPDVLLEGDPEEDSLALLYRHAQTFATGHGCSADWEVDQGTGLATSVSAECLPVTETRNVTPEITRDDGSQLSIPMALLAGLEGGDDDGHAALVEVIDLYRRWIDSQRARIAELPERYRAAATAHVEECVRAEERMRDGLIYLWSDDRARRAFQFANHAMLLQQLAARAAARPVYYDTHDAKLRFAAPYLPPNPGNIPAGRGEWRPFQIAFLLMSVRSAAEGDSPERRMVELVWFPTGGGKTEAYLGLAAFAMFNRRLDDRSDAGVHVLMRYTLRLLTAQQFQRASGLICATEFLRRRYEPELGNRPFSIGIWLGSETTPNTREQALRALGDFERYPRENNPFLLMRCPWCAAEFGRVEIPQGEKGRAARPKRLTPGYSRQGGTVVAICPDQACEFASGLPVFVVDEDIYDVRPTLVIGTIDKFAMLAWRPEARALFGLDGEGRRVASPPGLIIQDELHLIAGPLGSLAGLFETAIEELSTNRRVNPPIPPKIVGSTATIRRYREQIQALYARKEVALFPPPGLDAGDSFFARYDYKHAGRIFVGVHAASLGSVQTEWIRTFAALFQAPKALGENERDPWWTMVVFFNSIREMGTAHTLFQSDVPDYLKVVWSRQGTPPEQRRYLSASRIFELTGGLQSGEVSEAIARLEVRYGTLSDTPMDICLASNIIEVGIDIPRLSMMVVAGQPKTTSQYIQVTGRVGRLEERPGLIVAMYSPSKPRDRSHFERFRSYHERLYAHVEPTSVTPFSPPALERALHAVLTAYARQSDTSGVAGSPYPYPSTVVERFRVLVLGRAAIVDPGEVDYVATVLERRANEWRRWQRTRWAGKSDGEDVPLLRVAGDYSGAEESRLSWPTPMSMRNVDAECVAEITTLYISQETKPDA